MSLFSSRCGSLSVPPRLLQLCPVVDVALGLVNDQLGLVNCECSMGPTLPPCHLCSGHMRTVALSPLLHPRQAEQPPHIPPQTPVLPRAGGGDPAAPCPQPVTRAAADQSPSTPEDAVSPPNLPAFSPALSTAPWVHQVAAMWAVSHPLLGAKGLF